MATVSWSIKMLLVFYQSIYWTAKSVETPQVAFYYRVEENVVAGSIVADLSIDFVRFYHHNDVDQLSFLMLDSSVSNVAVELFDVDEETGMLTTSLTSQDRFDREQLCDDAQQACVVAFDILVHPYVQLVSIEVEVLDVNDNTPNIELIVGGRIELYESAELGTELHVGTARDLDSLRHGIYSCHLANTQSPENTLESKDGVLFFSAVLRRRHDDVKSVDLYIRLVSTLDRETDGDLLMMTLTVCDRGDPALSSSAQINISVVDVNDNVPHFTNSSYDVTLREDIDVGEHVVTLQAVDSDTGLNAKLEYLLDHLDDADADLRHSQYFHINRSSGVMTLAKPIDYEKASLMTVDVIAKDCGHYPLSQHTTVVIVVVDVNDHAPRIRLRSQLSSSGEVNNVVEVSELARPGSLIAHLSVNDLDSADNGRFSCFLGGFDVGGLFALRRFHHGEYALTVSGGRRLDHERRRRYAVTMTCADHGKPPAVSILYLNVVVSDENDNGPQFAVNPVVTSLMENNVVGAVVVVVSATDRDISVNGHVTYSLEPAAVSRWLALDHLTGNITSKVSFDREEISLIEFDVVAVDGGHIPRSARTHVQVTIEDQDDEVPRFVVGHYVFHMVENQPRGSHVGSVSANDRDHPPWNHFSYVIDSSSTTSADVFHIDVETGRLTTTLDHDDNTGP